MKKGMVGLLGLIFILVSFELAGGARPRMWVRWYAPAGEQPRAFMLEELATIGLADFETGRYKIFEVHIDAGTEGVTAGIPNVYLDVVLEFEAPDIFEGTNRGHYRIGPIPIIDDFSFSNQDIVDIYAEGKEMLSDELKAKLEELAEAAGVEEIEDYTEVEAIEELEEIGAEIDMEDLRGLLPEFEIRFEFTLLDEDKVTILDGPFSRILANTNPNPIEIISPLGGTSTRPSFQWEIPDVPSYISYLENELIIKDADTGEEIWSRTISISPGYYNRLYTFSYPSEKTDLQIGKRYRQVNKLRDPVGKLVGVGADPEGESGEFWVEVVPVELDSPAEGDIIPSLTPTFSWTDPNSGEIKDQIGGYKPMFSSQSSFPPASTWEVDVGDTTEYQYDIPAHPLEFGETYYAKVTGYDQDRNLVADLESEQRSFIIAHLVPTEIMGELILSPRQGTNFREDQTISFRANQAINDNFENLVIEWRLITDLGEEFLGEGLVFETTLSPEEYRVRLTVYHPDYPDIRQEEEVNFGVYSLLAGPTLLGLERQYKVGDIVEVEVEFSGGKGPYDVEVLLDGVLVEEAGATNIGAGSHSFSLTNLKPGTYLLEVNLTDSEGNTASQGVEFEVVPPVITHLSLRVGEEERATFALEEVITFSGLVDDPMPFEESRYNVKWFINEEKISDQPLVTVPAENIGLGEHTVKVELSFDEMGVLAQRGKFFSITEIVIGVTVEGLQESYKVGEEIGLRVVFPQEGTPPYRIDLLLDGQEIKTVERIEVGPCQFTLPDLESGTHVLQARITDSQGNIGISEEVGVSVIVPPIIDLILTAKGEEKDVFELEEEITFDGLVGDPINFAESRYSYKWFINGVNVSNKASFTDSGLDLELGPGEHLVKAELSYKEMGALRQREETFFLAEVVIGVSIEGLKESYKVQEEIGLNVAFQEKGTPPYIIDLLLNGEKVGTATGVETGPYPFSLANLRPGSYTLQARITDSEGNVGTSSEVNLQVIKPQITKLILTAGGEERYSFEPIEEITFDGLVDDPVSFAESGYNVKWIIDGKSVSWDPFFTILGRDLGIGWHLIEVQLSFADLGILTKKKVSFSISEIILGVEIQGLKKEYQPREEIPFQVVFEEKGVPPYDLTVFLNGLVETSATGVMTSPQGIILNGQPPGDYFLQLNLIDDKGNSSTSSEERFSVIRAKVLENAQINITSPEARNFMEGIPITFRAEAYNTFAEPLSEKIQWSIEDRVIGSGAEITISDLKPGFYLVVASVEIGSEISDSIQIRVYEREKSALATILEIDSQKGTISLETDVEKMGPLIPLKVGDLLYEGDVIAVESFLGKPGTEIGSLMLLDTGKIEPLLSETNYKVMIFEGQNIIKSFLGPRFQ